MEDGVGFPIAETPDYWAIKRFVVTNNLDTGHETRSEFTNKLKLLLDRSNSGIADLMEWWEIVVGVDDFPYKFYPTVLDGGIMIGSEIGSRFIVPMKACKWGIAKKINYSDKKTFDYSGTYDWGCDCLEEWMKSPTSQSTKLHAKSNNEITIQFCPNEYDYDVGLKDGYYRVENQIYSNFLYLGDFLEWDPFVMKFFAAIEAGDLPIHVLVDDMHYTVNDIEFMLDK